MKVLLLLFFTIFITNVYAGSNNIKIYCKSESGRSEIYGNVPGDFAEYYLTVKIDKDTLRYSSDKIKNTGSLRVISGFKNNIFAISFPDNGYLYSIP